MVKMIYEVEVEFHKNFLKVNGDQITVGLTNKPERGKANRELIRKLAKHFKISTSQVQILKGHRSRSKTIDIKFET